MRQTDAAIPLRNGWLISLVLGFSITVCSVGVASADGGTVQATVQESIVEIMGSEYDQALGRSALVVKGLGVVRSIYDEYAAHSEIVTTAELGEHGIVRYGGSYYRATLDYLDKDAGIAILSVSNMRAWKAVETRNTEVNIGERVYLVGRANGANTVHEATVSLKIKLESERNSLLQTTLQGPILGGTGVFDASGRLVGITTLRHEAEGQASKHVAISSDAPSVFRLPSQWH